MDSLISIIVPVYNIAPYLGRCLDSLVRQTYRNIEVICVNDGSVDGSAAILKDYADRFDRVVVIDQDNRGVSAARNAGLDRARGEYVMFVDGDDWIDEDMCAAMIDAASKHGADAVMCSYVKEFPGRRVVNHIFQGDVVLDEAGVRDRIRRRLFGMVGEETARPQDIDLLVSPWMQLFHKSVCEGIRFVDLDEIGTCEDCLYQMEAYSRCRKFVYIDKPFYHYRKTNDASLTSTYRQFLLEHWQNLYERMEQMIRDECYHDVYSVALKNRVCFAFIGLGLNEMTAHTNIFKKSYRLHHILTHWRYIEAFRELDVRYMPIHWKVFFVLAKSKKTLLLAVMLQMIIILKRCI